MAAPPWLFPADPVLTLRAVNRSLRHGYDGRFATDGTLACRVSGQERTQFAGLVDGAELVAPLGNGGLPPECDDLLAELVLEDTTQLHQTAAYAADARSLPVEQVAARLTAEHALRWDTTADPAGKDLLRAASLWAGTEPSPLATTFWRQPWIPMFCEWELTLRVDGDLTRWQLTEVDLDVAEGASPDPGQSVQPVVTSGRVLLTSVAARTFAAQVAGFVSAETQRGPGLAVLQPGEQAALSAVAAAGARYDLLSGGLAGLREELLGLAWADAGRVAVNTAGTRTPPAPGRGAGAAARRGRQLHPAADHRRVRPHSSRSRRPPSPAPPSPSACSPRSAPASKTARSSCCAPA